MIALLGKKKPLADGTAWLENLGRKGRPSSNGRCRSVLRWERQDILGRKKLLISKAVLLYRRKDRPGPAGKARRMGAWHDRKDKGRRHGGEKPCFAQRYCQRMHAVWKRKFSSPWT